MLPSFWPTVYFVDKPSLAWFNKVIYNPGNHETNIPHFLAEICTHVHILFQNGTLWDMVLVHGEICAIRLYNRIGRLGTGGIWIYLAIFRKIYSTLIHITFMNAQPAASQEILSKNIVNSDFSHNIHDWYRNRPWYSSYICIDIFIICLLEFGLQHVHSYVN